MRSTILPFVFAAMALSVSACASTPTRYAGAAEVPMYSPSEWTAMNTESTVAPIPEDDVSSSDSGSEGAATFTGYSGNFGAFDSGFGSSIHVGGSAAHGAIGGASSGFSGRGFSSGGFSAGGFSGGHGGTSSVGHGSSGGHSSGGGHGGGHGGR